MATLQKTLAQDKQVIVEVRDRINNIYNQKKIPLYKYNVTLHVQGARFNICSNVDISFYYNVNVTVKWSPLLSLEEAFRNIFFLSTLLLLF